MGVGADHLLKKIGFVFPGQGSQTVGMLSELSSQFPIIQETFTEATNTLQYDLWNLIQHDPEHKLNQTQYTQPALLVSSIALWRLWMQQKGTVPSVLAGHSLGEYTALVCAGAIDFKDAILLVAERGRLMQEAVPQGEGAMAAVIGLNPDQIWEVCQRAAEGQVVEPANYNAEGQIVIAGHTEAVHRAMTFAKESGAKLVKALAMSVPSHCSLMNGASKKLEHYLNTVKFKKPTIPVLNNVDAVINEDPDVIKQSLVLQLYRPVQWVEIIKVMAAFPVEAIVECGPGKVLTGLGKRITNSPPTFATDTVESLKQARRNLDCRSE